LAQASAQIVYTGSLAYGQVDTYTVSVFDAAPGSDPGFDSFIGKSAHIFVRHALVRAPALAR
jgi:hypothetical protein